MSGRFGSVSRCGDTDVPLDVVWVKPATPGRMPLAPGKVPNRLLNDRFCMITTITRFTGDWGSGSGPPAPGGGSLLTFKPRQPDSAASSMIIETRETSL